MFYAYDTNSLESVVSLVMTLRTELINSCSYQNQNAYMTVGVKYCFAFRFCSFSM